jgi:hypothetical protein
VADSLSRHSKRYGLVSPVSRNIESFSFHSAKEEFPEDTKDAEESQYSFPSTSSHSEGHYAPWIVFDMCDASQQAETEEVVLDDFDLPYVEEEDFNYYPERSPRPQQLYIAGMAATEESLILRNDLKMSQPMKSNMLAEKTRHKFKLRETMVKLAQRLSCKT